MAATDDNHVEFGGEKHGGGEFYANVSRETTGHLGSTWNNIFAALQHRMISLERYVALFSERDLRNIFLASVLGRLPIGLTGLAVLLLVQTSTGSFARGGAAAACYVAGLAAVAPAIGRVIDRYGPRRILLACGLLFPAALVALVAAARLGAPLSTIAFAAAAGASFPPITVCMRTYFRQRFGDDALLAAAYSAESVLIEIVFIVGPMLVALFVAFASPAMAVWFSALCGFAGTFLFLRSPALRAWRIEVHTTASLLGPLADGRFVRLVMMVLCFATAFGLMEIGVTAYATEAGDAALAGVLLGVMSAGSALGGLAYGSRGWHYPLARQFATALAAMSAGLAVLALHWGPWLFAAWCVVAGVAMAPALIIQSMLVAKTAKAGAGTSLAAAAGARLLLGR